MTEFNTIFRERINQTTLREDLLTEWIETLTKGYSGLLLKCDLNSDLKSDLKDDLKGPSSMNGEIFSLETALQCSGKNPKVEILSSRSDEENLGVMASPLTGDGTTNEGDIESTLINNKEEWVETSHEIVSGREGKGKDITPPEEISQPLGESNLSSSADALNLSQRGCDFHLDMPSPSTDFGEELDPKMKSELTPTDIGPELVKLDNDNMGNPFVIDQQINYNIQRFIATRVRDNILTV